MMAAIAYPGIAATTSIGELGACGVAHDVEYAMCRVTNRPQAPLIQEENKRTPTADPLPDCYLQNTCKFAGKSALIRRPVARRLPCSTRARSSTATSCLRNPQHSSKGWSARQPLFPPPLYPEQCVDAIRPLLRHRSARLHRARWVAAVLLAVATPCPKVAARGPGASRPPAEASSWPPHPNKRVSYLPTIRD